MMNYIELEKKINRDFDNFISQYSEDSHEFFILEGLRTNIIMTAISIYRNKKLLSRNLAPPISTQVAIMQASHYFHLALESQLLRLHYLILS